MIFHMIYISSELDFLDWRLHELGDLVEKFIVVEYPFDYSGQGRKMYYNENKERFKKFENKIVHVINDKTYGGSTGLSLLIKREEDPLLMEALVTAGIKDGDFVLTCDGDAVVRRSVLQEINHDHLANLFFRWCQYWCNYATYDVGWNWAISAPWRLLKHITLGGWKGHRHSPDEPCYTNMHAGWHFGRCGGIDAIIENIKGHPHQEHNDPRFYDRASLQERIDNGWGWNDLSRGTGQGLWKFIYEDYKPENWPQYVNDHPEIFKKYFCFDKGAKNLGEDNWK